MAARGAGAAAGTADALAIIWERVPGRPVIGEPKRTRKFNWEDSNEKIRGCDLSLSLESCGRTTANGFRTAKPIRSISVDITLRCNLRCTGCYFFSEGMDKSRDADAETFEAFVADEVARGTNFVTVIGGESSLALSRLRWLYGSF